MHVCLAGIRWKLVQNIIVVGENGVKPLRKFEKQE